MAFSGMTGFARVEGAHGAWTWAVEARSVNGRNLDVRFRGPPGFDSLERGVREAVQKRLQRGHLQVSLTAARAAVAGAVRVDEALLERLLTLSDRYIFARRVARPRFDGMLALRGVMTAADDEGGDPPDVRAEVEAAMAASLSQAVDALHAARLEEGAALAPVLGGLIDWIDGFTAQAQTHAAAQGPALKARFVARLTELGGEGLAPDRIAQEAAALAVKADVREELDRLSAHVASARALIAGDGPAGRKLDFLTQEFVREANTLCAKSASNALTAVGLELKAVIEQVREQVQNVE